MNLYTTNNGKKVLAGIVHGDTFSKKVTPRKHFLRMYSAYAIQLEIYMQLLTLGVKKIQIIEPTRTLYSDILNWKTKSISVDMGHGKQIALPVKFMSDSTQKTLL